jgi:hypothetical protein
MLSQLTRLPQAYNSEDAGLSEAGIAVNAGADVGPLVRVRLFLFSRKFQLFQVSDIVPFFHSFIHFFLAISLT